MDPAEFAALAKRLIDDAQDSEALAAAHMMELTDPGGYALLLEKVAYGSGDPRVGSRWFVEAATVWSESMGDTRRSENLLRKAVKSDPWNEQAVEQLARFYDERGDQESLIPVLESRASACASKLAEVEDGKGRTAAMYVEIGRRWSSLRSPRPDLALAAFDKAMTLDPRNLEGIRGARALHIAAARWPEVIATFDRERALLRKSRDHVRLLREEASVRRAAGDMEGVAQALRLALGCDANDTDVMEELANCFLDRIKARENVPALERSEAASLFLTLAGSYQGEIALSHALNALSADPANDKAMELAGRIASSLGHDAVLPPYWAAYLKASPSGSLAPRIRMALSETYQASGQYGEAAEVLAPLEAQNAKVAQKVQMLLKKAGRIDDLVSRLDKQAASLPAEARFDVLLQAARLLAGAGRTEAAAQRYTQVLAIQPGYAEAVKVVSDHLRERKDWKGLSGVLLSAAKQAKTPPDQRNTMMREVARLSLETGELDQAYEILSKLQQTNRSDETIRDQYKQVLERTSRWDELAKILGREIAAARSAEETIASLKQLASLQENKIGDLEQAANTWSRISMLAPEDGAALVSAVDLYEKGKRLDLASSLLAAGLERIKNDATRATAFGRLAELLDKLGKPLEAAEAHLGRAQITGAPEAFRAAERLFAREQAWDKAAEALRAQLKGVEDHKQLAALHARLAGYLGQSGNLEDCVRDLEQACELDSDEEAYVAELERRNEAAGQLRRFVDFLLNRANAVEEKSKRSALRRRAARILRERLDDRQAALETLRAVLQDEEDPGALALLASDAESQKRYSEACELLGRLVAKTESKAKTPILLKLAKIRADGIGDLDGALEVFETILKDNDPRHVEALSEYVRIKSGRGEWAAVAEMLEHARKNADSNDRKRHLLLDLADVYEKRLENPKQATECLLAALEIEPGDTGTVRRLADLYELQSDWERVVEVLSQLVAAEADPEQASSLVLRRARVLEEKLSRVDDALAGLELLGDGGDAKCRDAFVEMADRHGRKELAASTLENWSASDASASPSSDRLVGAFDRYISCGRLSEAARVLKKLRGSEDAQNHAVRLEEAALNAQDFEVARSVHEFLLMNRTGLDRATERVRQVEGLVKAGFDRTQAIRSAEAELVGLAQQDVGELLGRLGELTATPEERLGLYERQVARSSGKAARVAALATAVGVAARCGLMAQCRRLFLLGVSVSAEDSDILPLEREAAEVDKQLGGMAVRRAYTEALVEAASNARGGETRRGVLLRRAAIMAHRDLGDTAQAFDWFNEALYVRIESAMVSMMTTIQQVADQVRELRGELRAATMAAASAAQPVAAPKAEAPPAQPARSKGPPPLPSQPPALPAQQPALPTQPPGLPAQPPPTAQVQASNAPQAQSLPAQPPSLPAQPPAGLPAQPPTLPAQTTAQPDQSAEPKRKGPPPLPQPPPAEDEELEPATRPPAADPAIPVLMDLTADDDDNDDETVAVPSEPTEAPRDEVTVTDFDLSKLVKPRDAMLTDPGTMEMPETTEPSARVDELSQTVESSESREESAGGATLRRPLGEFVTAKGDQGAGKDGKAGSGRDPRVRMTAGLGEVFSQREPKKAVDAALKLALEALGASAGMIHLFDVTQHEFVVTSCSGLNNSTTVGHRTHEDESTAAEVIQKDFVATMIEPGAERWYLGKRWWGVTPAPRVVLGASMVREGRLLGLLEIALVETESSGDERSKEALIHLAERLGAHLASLRSEAGDKAGS